MGYIRPRDRTSEWQNLNDLLYKKKEHNMSPKIRVAIAGASGVTGSSVMNALLATSEIFVS